MGDVTNYKGVELSMRTLDVPAGLDAQHEGPDGETPEEAPPLLFIDGELLPTTQNPETGGHWTYLLPYQEFDSLMTLGEAVVDYVHGRAAEAEEADEA